VYVGEAGAREGLVIPVNLVASSTSRRTLVIPEPLCIMRLGARGLRLDYWADTTKVATPMSDATQMLHAAVGLSRYAAGVALLRNVAVSVTD